MSNQKSEQNVSTSSMDASTITTASSDTIHPRQRIVQNFLLIWVDASIDESKQDCQNTLAQLQSVVNDVNIFTKRDEAVDFLTEAHERKVFLIVEGTIGQNIVPLIHDIPQLDVIYIFCGNTSEHQQWAKKWMKIKGIYTDIKPICQALQEAAKQYNQDSIAVSFVPMGEGIFSANLNQLEPSFMYTQIFKEILLEMEHDKKSIQDYILLWRHHHIHNTLKLKDIAEFERAYCPQSAITWYTREYFIYQMLNQALRLMEADRIINMGFFIRDLHQQIKEFHQKQIDNYQGKSFIVYRGQGLSKIEFEKLLKTRGGLMSFNNFLSTSKDPDVSLVLATDVVTNTDMVGILFKMSIDPSISSAPFASIREVSYFQTEEEILFSMHTVFRVGEITKIDENKPLYQVDLTLTADNDQQLRTLTERIREEVVGETGWERLGLLLIKISQFDKAEELYNALLEQKSDEGEKEIYCNNLGCIKTHQGDFKIAIEYFEKGLEICQKTLPSNHPSLATSYSNIGEVYRKMGEYSKAVSFYEKALEINEKTLPSNHPDLATFYNNIGMVYMNMGEYSKALSSSKKTLEIKEKTLPPNHPDLATSYGNIGLVYKNMGEYSKALSLYEKALQIRQKSLPANYPDLATAYNNIGSVHSNMGEYAKALSCYEKALEIMKKSLPANHPDLATSYNNIGSVYDNMGEYSKVLSFYEKALEIRQKTLPPNHPDFAQTYNNIGSVFYKMGEYPKALSFYEKALEIDEKTLPPNHPDLATSYNNIAGVYMDMGEYSKALSFYEKALEIDEKTLPANHPDFAQTYNNIGIVYMNMGKYSKALSFYEKTREICQKTLPPNHSLLATSYNNIGSVFYKMGEHLKALSFYEKVLEIRQKTLPPNHPDFAQTYNNIGEVYQELGKYLKALSSHEKALEIRHKTFPPNHPDFAQTYNNIASVYYNMGEYFKALSFYQRALNIFQSSLPSNHPNIKTVQGNIEYVKQKL